MNLVELHLRLFRLVLALGSGAFVGQQTLDGLPLLVQLLRQNMGLFFLSLTLSLSKTNEDNRSYTLQKITN